VDVARLNGAIPRGEDRSWLAGTRRQTRVQEITEQDGRPDGLSM